MDIQSFLSAVQQNADRVTAYALGCDGSDGRCDCIGLIIGALRLAGQSWTGIHGSNYAARYAVQSLQKISAADTLLPGQLVFKCREKGDDLYALPDRYQSHQDTRDYYHVGVVMSVSPLCIYHCSTGGMHQDQSLGAWRYAGFLSGMGEQILYTARVYAPKGGFVNLRALPDVESARIAKMQIGDPVDVLGENDADFYRVQYQGKQGYVVKSFLQKEEGMVTFSLDSCAARALYEALGQALKFS